MAVVSLLFISGGGSGRNKDVVVVVVENKQMNLLSCFCG